MNSEDYKDKRIELFEQFAEFVASAPVGSGVCVCGESSENHGPEDGHRYVDMWDYQCGAWLKELGMLK